jgi:hypothetical protein
MHIRKSILIVSMAMLVAVFAGCGSDNPGSKTAGPTSPTGASGGVAATTLASTYQDCLAATKKISKSVQSARARGLCAATYMAARNALSKKGDALENAYAACAKSANAYPDAKSKKSALASCEQIPHSQ